MRLFIAVELDARVKAAAADVAERLRQRLRRRRPISRRDGLGSAICTSRCGSSGRSPRSRADAIGEVLKEPPFITPAFDLTLAGCGAFPPSGPPRVFFIGVGRGAAEMATLYREVGERLVPLGFVPERRAYTAHLTICRIKDAGRGSSKAIRETLAQLPADCGACRVAAVTLFRAALSPRGATYEPLLR